MNTRYSFIQGVVFTNNSGNSMSGEISDYRTRKLSSRFHFLDRDRDGFITLADFVENMSKMREIGNLSLEDYNLSRKEHLSWWFLFYDYGKKNGGKVDERYFVERCGEYFSRKESIPFVAQYYKIMFDSIDTNKDGTITEDELLVYYKAHDVVDESYVSLLFKRLDLDSDGFISQEEFVHAGMSFCFSDDPKNGFEFLHQLPSST